MVLAEQRGLDLTYQTDVDLHERPGLLAHHRALITLGHDEYWSSKMRRGALRARADGVNIAFLGGNADYRHIRFEESPLGSNRRIVCYKEAREDPLYGIDDREVTSNWRDPPVPRPESALNGGFYRCGGVDAALVVSAPGSWLFEGTGRLGGERLPGVVRLEIDRVAANVPTPDTIQILAHSPVTCPGGAAFADVTYYTTTSGSGVIDVGNQGWVDSVRCPAPVHATTCNHDVVVITLNILTVLGEAPAGLAHPSESNLSRWGIVLQKPIHP